MTEKIVEMAEAEAASSDKPRIRLPLRHSPKLQQVIDHVNTDEELFALWLAQNVNAVDRLGMSDHGPVHMNIVANIALRLARLLHDHHVEFSLVKQYGETHGLTFNDAEVVVVLAALMHDVGMSIHRIDHEQYSLFVAQPILKRLLEEVYPIGTATIMRSEVLHAIISHRAGGRPLTVEAGIVRVGDALDMSQGRSRIPFQAGNVNIHSVSAAAIDKVEISHGEDRPIRIRIVMNNSAGIFQVDELMKDKLRGSGIEHYVEVEATVTGETEKKLVTIVKI
jgi:uncharacterized protein